MIVYYNPPTGSIYSIIEATNPDITPPCNQGTPLYLDDIEYADLWNNGSPLAHAYLIQNNVPTPAPPISESVMLSQVQSSQLASISAGYDATLAGGFQSNATGTSDTYASDSDTLQEIGWVRTISEASYPTAGIPALLQDGTYSAPLTYTQMNQLATDAQTWYLAQKGQLVALLGQVSVQQSPPTTPIAWSPGAYTPQPAPTS